MITDGGIVGWAIGKDPVLQAWPVRWQSPNVLVTCPHCGVRAVRHAANWSNNIYNGLRCTILCENGGTFDTVVPLDDPELVRDVV